MANVFMDISNDGIFKRVFGRRANKELLIGILNEILDELNIVDLEYLSPEVTGFDSESKNSRMDLRVQTNTGYELIIEMQVKDQHDFHDRAVYYACLPILEEVESGEKYYSLTPRYMVSFLHFSLRRREDPHWKNEFRARYALREQVTMEKLSDAMNLVFIELDRFNKSIEQLENDKERFYFCMKHIAEFSEIPKEFEGNKLMELLFRTTAVESLSDKDKLEYYTYMTTERDRRNQEAYALEKSHNEGLQQGLKQGLEQGLEQGLQRGRQEGLQEGIVQGLQEGLDKGRLEMALLIKNLRLAGMSDAKIAQMAGLSEEEIKTI